MKRLEDLLSLAGVDQDVEKILQEKQKNKKFKDAGKRIAGSKKERAAYNSLININDLENLEKDEGMADLMVVKDKVWPKYDPQQEKDKGISAGVAYIKTEIRKAFPSKPRMNNLSARIIYMGYAKFFMEFLEKTRSVTEIIHLSKFLRENKGIETIDVIYPGWRNIFKGDMEVAENKLHSLTGASIVNWAFGKTIYNLIFRNSESANKKWDDAFYYEGLSEQEAREKQKIWKERYDRELKRTDDRMDKIIGYSDLELKKEKKNWTNVSGYTLEEFKRIILSNLEGRLKNLKDKRDNPPKEYLQHAPIWEWADKKKITRDRSTPELRINQGKPLDYIKRTGGIEIPFISEHEIIRLFGFQAVELGNYVKDIEAKEHIRHFLGASADLFEVLNFDSVQVNQLNSLSISFGSRGRAGASASYSSRFKIINLTKNNGDGAVAHEWGHYLDHLLFNKLFNYSGTRHPLASFHIDTQKLRPTGIESEISMALYDVMNYIVNGTGENIKVNMDFPAVNTTSYSFYYKGSTSVAEALEMLKIKDPNIFQYGYYRGHDKHCNKIFGGLAKKFNKQMINVEVELVKKEKSSMFYYYSSKMNSNYWIAPYELFARAFEVYVFDKLEKAGRCNNYLVSGSYFDHELKVYPQGKEREDLFKLFDRLMLAIKKDLGIKDFKPFTNKRVDEYIELDENNNGKVKRGLIVGTNKDLLILELKYFKKLRMSKTSMYYGVEFNELESMLFNKYLVNEQIAMNTIKKEERTRIAKEWLKSNKDRIAVMR